MLRETLNAPVRVTATFRLPDGRALRVRKATQAEPAQHQFYRVVLTFRPARSGWRALIIVPAKTG